MKLKEVEVWGPWIDHDGTCIPVKPKTYVTAKYADGSSAEFRAMCRIVYPKLGTVKDFSEPQLGSKRNRWLWDTLTEPEKRGIVSYRVRKSALQMLQGCLNVVQEPVVSPVSV